MPIGFWKGTGLALMLDLVASILSAGLATADLGKQSLGTQSQPGLPRHRRAELGGDDTTERIIAALKKDEPNALYPGERVLRTRRESMTRGVKVDPDVWNNILQLEPKGNLNDPPGTSSS